jgi:hypothetical protein
MASSWRRALVGVTLGTLAVVWFVTFLASNMDEGSSGSSTLSASAFTISREGSTLLTPSTASPIITEIESDLIITEIPTKGVKGEADANGDEEEGETLEDTPIATPRMVCVKKGRVAPAIPRDTPAASGHPRIPAWRATTSISGIMAASREACETGPPSKSSMPGPD